MTPEAQLSMCLLTVKDEDVDGITETGDACFQEKYYLGYVLLEQLSIATVSACSQDRLSAMLSIATTLQQPTT